MVFIRVDANEKIATGHVMRCITVAAELQNKGRQTLFVTADDNAKDLITDNGFRYICLGSRWDHMEEELPKLEDVFARYGDGNDVLVVDSYMATPTFLNELAQKIKTVYFDDLFEDIYDVDMIINYNLYHSRFLYEKTYEGTRTRLLLGGRYVPLRNQFFKKKADVAAPAGNEVLLMCGGGDRYRILPDLARSILSDDTLSGLGVSVNIVLGAYSDELDEINDLNAEYGRINIFQNVSDMAALMGRCRAAVSAASTVLYELCALNIPTVFFCMADNQEYDREAFDKMMSYAGDIRDDRSAVADNAAKILAGLLADETAIKKMKSSMDGVIDGHGAERIVKEICTL